MCILIPLLVGLISALLGYLLGKMGSNSNVNIDNSLQNELDECRRKSAQLLVDYNALKSSSAVVDLYPFNADLAFAAFGKKVKQDDLKIIEGIGPKIEELFHNAGIKTWKNLGETSVEKCQQILDSAGEQFVVHNPGTWPKQSEMAYKGLWKELKSWQDELDGGK